MIGLLIGLNIILAGCGYLFPLPSAILALREWLKMRNVPAVKAWRRSMSLISLLLLTAGMALWIYAVVREVRGTYSYVEWGASVGRWDSLGLIVVSLFAESRLRRYLLLGAAGLLFFFGSSIGDIAI